MKFWKLVSTVTTLVLSTSVNASVLNTLNGVNYEWLELTETQGLSRDAVELRLSDVNDVLYGYGYASRQQVEDLFLSYTAFDGVNGSYGAPDVISGILSYFSDFGYTYGYAGDNENYSYNTVDGYTVQIDSYIATQAFYGLAGECGTPSDSCYSHNVVYADVDGMSTMAGLYPTYGWDSNVDTPSIVGTKYESEEIASLLVRTAVVPVPAAVWLFGSGLISLIGVARRKKA